MKATVKRFSLAALGLVLASGVEASTHSPTSTDTSSSIFISTATAERHAGPSVGMDFNSRIASWAESAAILFDSFANGLILLFR